jgi:hypothetical protein
MTLLISILVVALSLACILFSGLMLFALTLDDMVDA